MGEAYPPPVNAVTQDRLREKIARRIRAEGPLSVAAYMAMALYDPETAITQPGGRLALGVISLLRLRSVRFLAS